MTTVHVLSTCGAMVIFKRVKSSDGSHLWETDFPIKEVTTCPFCGSSDLETRSPISCKQCGKRIGTITEEGKLRVRGNPFRNWKVSPLTGLVVRNIKILREKV